MGLRFAMLCRVLGFGVLKECKGYKLAIQGLWFKGRIFGQSGLPMRFIV